MREPLEEKLESQRDKRERQPRSPLPRMATIAAVVALFASVVLIVVGAVSIAHRGAKTKGSGDPVAASLANASQSQAEEQLQQWRSQIFDGSGKLIVHGASTTAAGDAVRFDGQLFASGAPASGSEDGNDETQVDGVVEVVLRRNPRGRLKREWQPRIYSFHVAMLNGSAFVWKSVVGRSGYEYLVSEACVARADVPAFAQVVADALLLPAAKRQSSLTVERAFSPAVRRRSKTDISIKDDAVRLSMANESFDLWQLSRNYSGSGSSDDDDSTDSSGSGTSSSSSTKPTRKIWMLNGANVTMSLRLEDDSSEEFNDAVIVPAMMLVDYQRAFRSCSSLFGARSPSADGQPTTTVAPSRAEESAPASHNPMEWEEDAGVPVPLREWAKTLRSSSTPSQGNRRLSVAHDLEKDGEDSGGSDADGNSDDAGGSEEETHDYAASTLMATSPVGPVVNATKCVDGRKKCLFVHGIGVHRDVGLVSNFTGYWGEQVLTAFPCCSELKFTHFNTVDCPWYSPTLARATCNAAVAVAINATFRFPTSDSPTGGRHEPLRDVVIVSHSSGVLNVASAFMHGYCSLSPASSKWIAIQGPILGSHTANNVVADCGKPASSWDSTVKRVLTAFDLCPEKKSTQSLVRNGTDAAGPCLDGLYTRAAATFRANVNGSLCGVSAEGISSSDSTFYSAMAEYSDHENPDENDGAASFDSCRGGFPASKYRPTFESAFYKAALNHADGRLIHGDAWSEDQQPIRWLQRQIL